MGRSPAQLPASGAAEGAHPGAEFLETNGLGGYSCSTLSGLRTCPAHGLVVVAQDPPGKRFVLLNGFEVRVTTASEEVTLLPRVPESPSSEAPGRLLRFHLRPWPVWHYSLGDGQELEFECLARHGTHQFLFAWQLTLSDAPVLLKVRPLLSGRPLDSPRQIDPRLDFHPKMPSSRQFVWALRAGAPALTLLCDGHFQPDPKWIQDPPLPGQPAEALASPCEFVWNLQPRDRAHLVASAQSEVFDDPHTLDFVAQFAEKIRKAERTRRRLFRSEIDLAADQYVISGRAGSTVLSGYPSGGELGSSALMSVRGIALSPGRLNVASDILATWRRRLAAGLLPSAMTEHQRLPVFRSPAPALWYVIASYEYIRASYRHGRIITPEERASLQTSIEEILASFAERHHRATFLDEDGLLAEAVRGTDSASTGLFRKRAHIQALWMAALRIGHRLQTRSPWSALHSQARAAFEQAFWNSRRGHLYQAILANSHGPVQRVERLDLHQILAVGGLPIVCLDEAKASLLVHALEPHFLSGNNVRTSTPIPWQFGPFIEAWFRVHHRQPDIKELVLHKFIVPWQRALRCGLRTSKREPASPAAGPSPEEETPRFAAAETMELLRILHLPELVGGAPDPFHDRFHEPLFYD